MAQVRLRRQEDADLPAVLAISNRINWDAPPWTVERAQAWLVAQSARARVEQWVAEDSGEIAGDLLLWEMWGLAEAGTWQVILEVADHARQRGIGSRLFELLMQRAGERSIKRLLGQVREDRPESLTFVERRGCRRTGNVERFSRLRVCEARLETAEAIERQVASSGIRIQTLAETGIDDERLLHALHRLYENARRDIPHGGRFVERPFDDWRAQSLEWPDTSLDRFWVAFDGPRPIGLTRLTERSETAMYHAFLGVDRAYRGRGIALALKLHTIHWARDHGIECLYTTNDADNARMLAINESLGYVQLPAGIEVEWTSPPTRAVQEH